jgi:hypothetical protein
MFGNLKIDGTDRGVWWDTAWGGGAYAPPSQDQIDQWLIETKNGLTVADKKTIFTVPTLTQVNVLDCDGTTDVTSDDDRPDLIMKDGGFTISANVLRITSDLATICGRWSGTHSTNSFLFALFNNKLTLFTSNGVSTITSQIVGQPTMSAGQKYSVSVTKSGTEVTFVFDGVSYGSTLAAYETLNDAPTTKFGISGPFSPMDGIISDVVVTREASDILDVVLVAGQSNAIGWDNDFGDLPLELQGNQLNLFTYDFNTDDDLPYYPRKTGRNEFLHPVSSMFWGTEITAGDYIYKNNGNRIVAFIKVGRGGINMTSWEEGNFVYDDAVATIIDGMNGFRELGYVPKIRTMIWMQGESDATTGSLSSQYYDRNISFFENFPLSIKEPIPSIIIPRIQEYLLPERPYESVIRDACDELGKRDDVTVLSTDDLTFADGIHYDANSRITLGERIGAVILGLGYEYEDPGIIGVQLAIGSGSVAYDRFNINRLQTITNGAWGTSDIFPALNALRGFGSGFVPVLADGSAAADGSPITNFGGYIHNQSEVAIHQTDVGFAGALQDADAASILTHINGTDGLWLQFICINGMYHINKEGWIKYEPSYIPTLSEHGAIVRWANRLCDAPGGQLEVAYDLDGTPQYNLPSRLISYLPEGTPYTTPSLGAATPTKVLIPTTVKTAQDFALFDIGGGDIRFQYQGSETRSFRIGVTTGMQTSANNTIVKLRMYKNSAPEPGIYIPRKVGTGTDVGALGIEGYFTLDPLDTISVWVESSIAGTVTFDGISIVIIEVN